MSYFARWRLLGRTARLYLLHVALQTFSLAIFGLFFNFAILALGFPIEFLGLLNTASFAAAAALSAPLLWLVTRLSLRWTLLASALLQLVSVLLFAGFATPAPLLLASAIGGVAAVLFDVSASPFMMRHSDEETRDLLFSANAAIRIGVAGAGSLLAGQIPALAGALLGVPAASAPAYRLTLALAAVGLALAIVPLLLISGRRGVSGRQVALGAEQLVDDQLNASAAGESQTTNEFHALSPKSQAPSPVSQAPQRIWRELIRHPIPLFKLLLSPALISVGAALLIPYLNLFFRQRFAVGDQALGAIFAGLGIATGLASLSAPAISARIGKIRTIVWAQALALPFLVVMGLSPTLSVAIGAALARAALFNMGTPLYDAFAMERTQPAARPTVIGLLNGAASLGYAFGPLLSTRIQAAYGFGPLFVATGLCYALAVLAKYWFFIRRAVDEERV